MWKYSIAQGSLKSTLEGRDKEQEGRFPASGTETPEDKEKQQNALPNGLICLKGGELEHETMPFKHKTVIYNLSDSFEEEFFQTKKVVYVPI